MAGPEPATVSTKTRILVVDDHFAVRQGLTRLLEQQPDLYVCAAVESAEQALECLERQPVDLAIVDISLGQMDGLELTERLRNDWPEIRILILSMHDPVLYAEKARNAGASGFVAKPKAGDTLLTAIRQILAGGLYFPPCQVLPNSPRSLSN